jgi:hypothetical protein
LSLSSKKYGVGIRDPENNLLRIPDPGPGVKKASDPGSGSETLVRFYQSQYFLVTVTFDNNLCAVFWNCNDLLRFRFRLWEIFGSGSIIRNQIKTFFSTALKKNIFSKSWLFTVRRSVVSRELDSVPAPVPQHCL